MGDIIVELDRSRAPITVNNFLRYVDKRSYEDTIFHRIVPDFVVQGGGYDSNFLEKPSFGKIFNESGNGLKNVMYNITMARQDDPHSATRQFFFNMSTGAIKRANYHRHRTAPRQQVNNAQQTTAIFLMAAVNFN